MASIQRQADLFERTVRTLCEPAEVVKSLTGSDPVAKPDREERSRRRR